MIIAGCILGWFLIGAVTFWYMETRYTKNDIRVSDLPLMILMSLLGVLTAIYAVIYIFSKSNRVMFKAKEDK